MQLDLWIFFMKIDKALTRSGYLFHSTLRIWNGDSLLDVEYFWYVFVTNYRFWNISVCDFFRVGLPTLGCQINAHEATSFLANGVGRSVLKKLARRCLFKSLQSDVIFVFRLELSTTNNTFFLILKGKIEEIKARKSKIRQGRLVQKGNQN